MTITNRVVNQEAQQQAAAFLQGIEVPDSYYADLVESVFLLPHQTQQFIPRPLIHLWTRTFTEILKMVNHDPQNMRSLAMLLCLTKSALSQRLYVGTPPSKRGPGCNFTRIKKSLNDIRNDKNEIFIIIDSLKAEAAYYTRPTPKAGDSEAAIKRAVIKKAQFGNYGAAITILDSKGMAPDNEITLKALEKLHPKGRDFRMPLTPEYEKWEFEGEEIMNVINGIKIDAAGGASGLKPAHLKSAMKAEAEVGSSSFADELAKFSSHVANGNINEMISPYLGSGRLFALKKSEPP